MSGRRGAWRRKAAKRSGRQWMFRTVQRSPRGSVKQPPRSAASTSWCRMSALWPSRPMRRRGRRLPDRPHGKRPRGRCGDAVAREIRRRQRRRRAACRGARWTSPAGPLPGAFKAALINYAQGLAYQLAAKSIRANTVSPGNTYFPGGVCGENRTGQPRAVRPIARAQSNGTDGYARPRLRAPWCFWQVRQRVLSPAPIWLSTVR